MTRRRAIALAVAAVVLVPVLALAGPARASANGLTRIRLTLSTTSDWATLTLRDIDVRVQATASVTPSARYYPKGSEWTLVPTTADGGMAVIDLVVEAGDGASPVLGLAKGRAGTATVDLAVHNGPTPVALVHEVLDTHDPFANRRDIPVDRTALGPGGLGVAPLDDRRLTLAFYYPWFGAGAATERRIGPDDPVAPFSTSDAASVGAMVDQARGAGVDGFVLSWEGLRHEGPAGLLFDAVSARPGFKVAPQLELRTLTDSTLLGERFSPARAAEATRQFFDRAPAGSVLTVGGRRVLLSFGTWDLSVDQWAAYRALVADLDLFVVIDRPDRAFAADGFYDYDPNTLSPEALADRADDAIDAARLRPMVEPDVAQRLWAATVSPGFDTRASQPLWRARTTGRDGGARYDMTWQVALGADPDWVLITSWNEWYEQTQIAPGTVSGTRALAQTAKWTARF